MLTTEVTKVPFLATDPPVFTMFWSGGSLGESCRVPIIVFIIDHCRIQYQLFDGAISQY